MKKTLKLIPALAMLLVSAILVSTSTYAWFSMNTVVTAKGMQVKAAAEGGIVISNSAKSAWTSEATAQVTTATLFPTSHAKSASGAWYHNTSDNFNDAKAGQLANTYETLTTAYSSNQNGGEGVAYVDKNNNSAYDTGVDSAYHLMNNFYIKSSGEKLNNTKLYLKEVLVSSTSQFVAIDTALRVLIVVGNDASGVFLYAPVSTSTATPTYTYKVAAATADTAASAITVKNVETGITTIPNGNDDAINIKIYVFFEGEDANCKSSNISGVTVDDVTVSVKFGTSATDPVVTPPTQIVGTISNTVSLTIETKEYYRVSGTNYYADTNTYTEGTTKFYEITGSDSDYTVTEITNYTYSE